MNLRSIRIRMYIYWLDRNNTCSLLSADRFFILPHEGLLTTFWWRRHPPGRADSLELAAQGADHAGRARFMLLFSMAFPDLAYLCLKLYASARFPGVGWNGWMLE